VTNEECNYHHRTSPVEGDLWWALCDTQPCRNWYNRIQPAEPARDLTLVPCSPSQESVIHNLSFHFDDNKHHTLSPPPRPLFVVSPWPVVAALVSNLSEPLNPIVGEFFRQLLSRPPTRPVARAMSAQNPTPAPQPAVNPTPGPAPAQAPAPAPLLLEDLVYSLAQSVQGLNATVATLSTSVSIVVGALS
jgi:hypothetical protein